MELLAQLDKFERDALTAISSARDERELEAVRIVFLGARQGQLKDLQALLGAVSKEEKPRVGKRFNDVKSSVMAALEDRKRALARPKVTAGGLDVTLPGIA